MQRTLKHLLFCCALLAGCVGHFRAWSQEPDSVYTSPELSEEGAEAGSFEDSETAEADPPRVILYNRQTPSEERWLAATSDDAYSYRTTREYTVQPPPKRVERNPVWLEWLIAFIRFFTTTTGKIILWALLLGILGYIIYRLVVGEGGLFGKRDLLPEPAASDELTAEGLMDTSWETRMRTALADGDGRAAIRFGYLHLLQQLQARELILFRPDKTNIAYYRELGEQLRPEFRSLTRVYEFAWYGGYLPDQGGLSAYMTQLDQFLQRITR